MATKAGVWIDHKQAIVVLVTEAGQEIKKIAFDIGQPVRSGGRSRATNKYTPNDFIAEDRQERKDENDRKNYYDEVVAATREATSILILGPGEAKGEFSKRIKSKKLRGVNVEVQTADKMTDRQLAAKVGEHFATDPASKSVAPKGTKNKSPNTSGKRIEKTKK
jgi:stalled ribosome rescue protein Dom34